MHTKSLGPSTAQKGVPPPAEPQIPLFPTLPEKKKMRRLRKMLPTQEIILEEGE